MKNLYTKLQLIAVSLLISTALFSQTTPSEKEIDGQTDSKNMAYCMVTGGNGSTGWATFPLTDPTTFEIIAPKPSDYYFNGGDIGPNGVWYATDYTGRLVSIDQTTGDFTLLATLSETLAGFTYSPAYETYFCCTGSELFTLDMSSYTLTSIGNMGNSGDMLGLGADNRGNLWGIDRNDNKLYSIDPITGLATAIGESGYNYDYMQNCTYDKDNDIMYHAGFWVAPSVFGGLFSYDLESGEATEITAFPNQQEVTAFAIPWTMPAHGAITGTVTDAVTGDPVENVSLTLEPMNGQDGSEITKVTAATGLYGMGVILPGEYNITAISSNYGIQIIENITVNSDDNLVYDFQLEIAPYQVTFHVSDFTNNEPVEDAMVNFVGNSLLTDINGDVLFENIATGTYTYTIDYAGYYEGFGEVVVTDANVEQDALLYIEDNVAINYVIIEESTGTWCGPCGILAPSLDEVYEAGHPVSFIAYHSGDDYENSAAAVRNGYYGVSAYPTLTYMGVEQTVGVVSANSIIALIEANIAIPTPIMIETEDMDYDEGNSLLSGKIRIENRGPINSDNLRLQIVLIENHIPEAWQSNPELNFVEREMYPDAEGTLLDFSAIGTQNITFEVPTTTILDMENSYLIAFLQDNFTKKIYNSTRFSCGVLTQIETASAEETFRIFPNPSNSTSTISAKTAITSLRIYDNTGRICRIIEPNTAEVEIDVRNLAKGIYLIKIETNGATSTQKLVVE